MLVIGAITSRSITCIVLLLGGFLLSKIDVSETSIYISIMVNYSFEKVSLMVDFAPYSLPVFFVSSVIAILL